LEPLSSLRDGGPSSTLGVESLSSGAWSVRWLAGTVNGAARILKPMMSACRLDSCPCRSMACKSPDVTLAHVWGRPWRPAAADRPYAPHPPPCPSAGKGRCRSARVTLPCSISLSICLSEKSISCETFSSGSASRRMVVTSIETGWERRSRGSLSENFSFRCRSTRRATEY
jgi:hypothetical protein